MNRIDHFKETFPQNISDNLAEEIEFLILDYNSNDGLQEWVFENFSALMKSNVVQYYRTEEPVEFSHSHSKNIAFKLAKGDIVCNVDADNFIGPKFYKYLQEIFTSKANCFVSSTSRTFNSLSKNDWITGNSDLLGRLAIRKKDFLEVGGYDETFTGYGFEDSDLINRLEMKGLYRVVLTDSKFLKVIKHDDSLRLPNPFKTFEIYVNQINYFMTTCIFLNADHSFLSGTIIDNKLQRAESFINGFNHNNVQFEFSLKQHSWDRGNWRKADNGNIRLTLESGKSLQFKKSGNRLEEISDGQPSKIFFRIKSNAIINDLSMFKGTIINRAKMFENLKENKIKANGALWGVTKLVNNYY
ncbi:glycosyltransferase family 2 protein [Olivibacter jilunii]|uniref:glycosyltransferase family 2 protein n=1 Tax=Olivibacter jilunii TaxID=985016 RepID=UPI003F14534F